MHVPFLRECTLGSAKLCYRKSTGLADPIPRWGCAVSGSSEMLLGQFCILTSSRVAIWRAPLWREKSVQIGREGLVSLTVAVKPV